VLRQSEERSLQEFIENGVRDSAEPMPTDLVSTTPMKQFLMHDGHCLLGLRKETL